jgi:glycosyltransferase involved in cell wall biosynthesis
MPQPAVSVVIPVFNAGAYLRDAVLSVLRQLPLNGQPLPVTEVLVVDDRSTDAATRAVLDEIASWPGVFLLRNHHSKGAAGARNTGIEVARGEWIGFLDADDIWFPHALAQRWRVVRSHPEAQWVAGKIRLLRPAPDQPDSGAGGFAPLARLLAACPAPPPEPRVQRMRRPVAELARDCIVIPTTTLIRQRLLVAKGLFDERLRRAEDYHLWFRCALDNDLWLVTDELAYYRIHPASLTHGDAPRFLLEDNMLLMLLKLPAWRGHRALLIARLDMVMQDHCYFYRGRHRYGAALRHAARWIRLRPFNPSAWKELLASGLRAG